MAVRSDGRAYSQVVNAQVNPNLTKDYNDWSNMGNAVDHTSVFAESQYKRKGKKGNYSYITPWVVTAHNFGLDIPEEAYITKVTLQVCMKVDSPKIKVHPPAAHFMVYGGTGSTSVTQQKSGSNKTGWYGSTYRVYNNKTVSTSEKVYEYEFSGKEWNKMAYPTKQLNRDIMGVDLHFNDPVSMDIANAGVYLRWVAIIVDYELPQFELTFEKPTTKNEHLSVVVEDTYCVNATLTNKTNASVDIYQTEIILPYGTELVSSNSNSADYNILVDTDDPQKYIWACSGEGKVKHTLKLCLKSHSYGLHELMYGNIPYYIDAEPCEDCVISYKKIQDGRPSCFRFKKTIYTDSESVKFYVTVDGRSLTDWSKVSSEFLEYYQNENQGNNLISWELEQSSLIHGVSIKEYTNDWIELYVPHLTEVEVVLNACFVPLFSGNNTIELVADGDTHTKEYYSLPAEPVELELIPDTSIWQDYYVATELGILGYVLRADVKETDKNMVEGECTLKAHIWEDLAYIGSIPLKHSHYEPDHDSTNEIISKSYKNKTYKGKEGEFKEDTGLKIKLPPPDWTTLRGFTKLDKPIPINTVPSAFEGDVLNFRGWYEIGGIKGVKKTNPLYYDGEIVVEPLTHNINTRFTIKKGDESNSFGLSKALAYIINSGDEFAKYSYINTDLEEVINDTGYFIVDTDGAYIYDDSEDVDDSLRTLIALDNSQYVNILSDEEMAEICSISMTWNSTKLEENKENNIERVINILNGKEVVFRYTYYDYNFDTNNEYYKCRVLGERLLDNGNWETVIEKDLNLAVDIESLQLEVDEDGNVVQESEPKSDEYVIENEEEEDNEIYSFNDYIYGTTVKFLLNNNILSIIDTGYNGQEIIAENIELVNGKYKFEANFVNHNTDGDSTDVITFFDFEVGESIITSDLGNLYKDMIISSFPIAGKKILFTRLSEEGTLYYYQHDNSEFSYIQEPFYMFFCGVDLQNQKGSSIFDLDNSYTTFYLNNGLVRVGFNRINGDIYIYKYDIYSKQFIHVCDLHCNNTDFEIGAFSDDKIELKAGTTVYSMYRGHPYLIINHPDEELLFKTSWHTAWAEKFNGVAYPFPIYFNFLNNSNLLTSDIGGLNISKKNISISDYENDDVTVFPTISLTKGSGAVYQKTPVTLTIEVDGLDEEMVIDYPITFDNTDEYTLQAVYLGDDETGVAFSDELIITPVQAPDDGSDGVGSYKMEAVNVPSTWEYMGKLGWTWRLTKGGVPVVGEVVEVITPTNIWTGETDSDGYVVIDYTQNNVNLIPKWTPSKTYTFGASYWHYENGEKDKVIADSYKKVKVTKGTVKVDFKEAGNVKKKARWNVKDAHGNNVSNKKVKIIVGSKTYTKTTNDNGNVFLTINKKGYKKYKIVIPSDSKFKSFTKVYTETVR